MGVVIPHTGVVVKLGRVKPRFPRPRLAFRNYLRAGLINPPDTWDGGKPLPTWGMLGNDTYGDCVFACIGHLIEWWNYEATAIEPAVTTEEVLSWYSDVTGFNPDDPRTDNGAVITDALDYWITTGYGGDFLAGYVAVQPTDAPTVKAACFEFGGVNLGVELPAAWQSQTGPGGTWDVGPSQRGQWSPGSWGGHSVPLVSYNAKGPVVMTWNSLQQMTWAALATYCDEVYAMASWDWATSHGTPTMVDRTRLVADFQALGGRIINNPPSPPSPPSPPVPPVPTPPNGGIITIDPSLKQYSFPTGWTALSSGRIRASQPKG